VLKEQQLNKGGLMKITYHNDSGHGWYSVKRSKLESMGVLNKVSGFSYQKGETVYLEENCDAGLFFNNLTSQELDCIEVIDSYSQACPVRNYERFSLI
jgi:hypothetical protein